MNRIITYGVEQDTGIVYSRVGSEVAVPVLDFAAIGQGGDGYEPGDFNGPTRYSLEKCSVYQLGPEYRYIRWTKKIPVRIKNLHREFWGFPLLGAGGLTGKQLAFLEGVAAGELPRYNNPGALHRVANDLIRGGLVADSRIGAWTQYSLTDAGREKLASLEENER